MIMFDKLCSEVCTELRQEVVVVLFLIVFSFSFSLQLDAGTRTQYPSLFTI